MAVIIINWKYPHFVWYRKKTEAKWKLKRVCFHSYQAADSLIENNNDNNNNDKNQPCIPMYVTGNLKAILLPVNPLPP